MNEGKPKSEQKAIDAEREIKEYRQWVNQAIVEAEIRIRETIEQKATA
jgi:hypothetical protein